MQPMQTNNAAASTHSARASDPRGKYFLAEEQAIFRDGFNRSSFSFSHRLAGHPLFELPRLVELAKRIEKLPSHRPDEVYFDAGDVAINQRWSDTSRNGMSVSEALERIHTSGAWMLIRRAELVEDYRIVLDECLAEIQELAGRSLDAEMEVRNAIVFITSPRRITSYHIDRECNFLLQVSGDKSISIFDQNDRTVLPEVELEKFWAVDNNAAVHKPEYQERARVYQLGPGMGVHLPVNAPHWVQNGDLPSISLSVNFQFRGRSRSDVYRANYYLRRLGLEPNPPGSSDIKDRVKRTLVLPVIAKANELRGALKQRLNKIAPDKFSTDKPKAARQM
ncbi:MAG TPA: hypothetical protein VGI10_00300 [Polyangiaceae bacterium]|jgi:hypothetical protein